jgi:hypothetical protein
MLRIKNISKKVILRNAPNQRGEQKRMNSRSDEEVQNALLLHLTQQKEEQKCC